MTPRVSVSWTEIQGAFDHTPRGMIFRGGEMLDPGGPNLLPAAGLCMSSIWWTGGRAIAEFEFAYLDELTECEFVLYRDLDSGLMLTAGIGDSGRYGCRRFDGENWVAYKCLGDRSNAGAAKRRIQVEWCGSSLGLVADGVKIFSGEFEPPSKSQIGWWVRSRGKVELSSFEVYDCRPKVFMVMPFSDPFNKLYKDVLRQACSDCDVDIRRADDNYGPGWIISDIEAQIEDCQLVIAEITTGNPNVYYEIGYAHARAKPTILIAEEGTQLPFDIAHRRVLFYRNSSVGRETLRQQIQRAIVDAIHSW